MLCINEMFIVDRWERVKKRGLFSLESFSRVLFLARAVVATCSGQPSLLSCLDGNFHSFQPLGRCQTPRWPTCRPPGSVGSPASLPFPSSLLNLCPASQHPWSVSPVALALSAEDLLPASCWLSSWKWKPVAELLALQFKESASAFAAASILTFNGWVLYKCSDFHWIC